MRGPLIAVRLLAATVCFGQPAIADVVVRRGAEGAIEGRITSIDDAGVSMRSEYGAAHFVPWDRVRDVEADEPAPTMQRFLETAEDLWRARSRVERGDVVLAEDLLERLFEQYRGRTHETALVVAEGLLRCRIAKGANAAALIPALETARLRRAGVRTNSYGSLPAVLDEATGLCPQLAPAWVNTRAVARLERDLAEYDAGEDEVIAGLAELYRRCARWQRGLSEADADVPGQMMDHPGIELMLAIEACHAPGAEQRLVARQRLLRQLPTLSPWAEAWARFALGSSQLRESGLGRRQRGMVNLLHVPARFGAGQPYLAGVALAFVAEAADSDGDRELAEAMRADLDRRYPNHPARFAEQPVLIHRTEDEP